jgi:hypothetical protein
MELLGFPIPPILVSAWALSGAVGEQEQPQLGHSSLWDFGSGCCIA